VVHGAQINEHTAFFSSFYLVVRVFVLFSASIRPSFSFMPLFFLVDVCSVSWVQRWREMASRGNQ
jgi:hypothetical protein